jgi:hypothetical protein
MNHLSQEDFVLQYYGEPAVEPEAASHLASCEFCAARFQELQQVLNSLNQGAVPERGEDYGALVWGRIAPRLEARPAPASHWRVWAAIAAMLVVSIGGFWLGRTTTHQRPVPGLTADGKGVKERILLVALTDHFERSQMILAEIANSDAGKNGGLDMAFERSQAEDLLDANRLYRLTAVANGNMEAASLLDDLERVLVDIAHAPDRATHNEMEALRQRIEDQGLTFKVKVFSTGLANQDKGRL